MEWIVPSCIIISNIHFSLLTAQVCVQPCRVPSSVWPHSSSLWVHCFFFFAFLASAMLLKCQVFYLLFKKILGIPCTPAHPHTPIFFVFYWLCLRTFFIPFYLYSEWYKELAAAAFSGRKPGFGKAIARFAWIELISVGVYGFLNVSFYSWL